MPLRRLKNIYEKRRSTLKNILVQGKTLDKDRKAEINGAITEIDALIKTIDNLRQQEIDDNRLLEIKGRSTMIDNIPIVNKIGNNKRDRFENSGTKKSLNDAFIKKCESRTKYELFGNIAKEEGYHHIAQIFFETANNEKEQAKIILEYMNETKNTEDNLRDSADSERKYHDYYYSHYEKIATEEKYPHITDFFKELAQIDAEHEKRFLRLLKNFKEHKIFRKDMIVKWRCKDCGYTFEGHDAPAKCKMCKAPKGKFVIYQDAY
ncbi:MAG: rubrerythrin family protein [Candidatus Woesearchaeota archaeon]